jgi:hypothetical protein
MEKSLTQAIRTIIMISSEWTRVGELARLFPSVVTDTEQGELPVNG